MSRCVRSSCLLLLFTAGVCDATGDRLLATGGAVSLEATAGGGITPWAVLAGYGSTTEGGCAGAVTAVETDDYGLRALGASCAWDNRIELSLGQQELHLGGLRPLLGLPEVQTLRMRQVGIKLRLAGDLLYREFGQWSAGLIYKQSLDGALARTAGADRTHGLDAYLSGGRLFLDGPFGYMAFVNGTLRYTDANQLGLLGFGGDRDSSRLQFELAVALFPRRDVALGFEYRQKPDNLGFAAEDDWRDLFVAWFPSKYVSVVAAWAWLGSIGTLPDQDGPYLSVAGSF